MTAPRKARFTPIGGARANDYDVRRIEHAAAAHFIRAHHYARGCANTSTEAFGLFRGASLVGTALWMPPTRACAETVDRQEWRRVVSLSRLAVAPAEPQNAASLFIGAMLRAMQRGHRWVAAVTFADLSQGHKGTIYKATNWTHIGITRPEPRWEDASGKQVSRLSTKSRTAGAMTKMGHLMVGKFSKHKFVFRFKAARTERLSQSDKERLSGERKARHLTEKEVEHVLASSRATAMLEALAVQQEMLDKLRKENGSR